MSKIFNRTKTVRVPLTISTAAYTANDVVGGLITVDVGSAGGGGILRKVVITDSDNKKAAFTLHCFDSAPATIADADAFAPTEASLIARHDVVTIEAADYVTINSMAQAVVSDLAVDFEVYNGYAYYYLVATATPDYDNADALTLTLTYWMN